LDTLIILLPWKKYMCGIAGKITITGQVNAANLKRMADAIAHRGPDDSGCEIVDGARVGLVNRRLAIVDRSFAGHQPM
jgi:asparagine synthase (glutamine-hydrolysing)